MLAQPDSSRALEASVIASYNRKVVERAKVLEASHEGVSTASLPMSVIDNKKTNTYACFLCNVRIGQDPVVGCLQRLRSHSRRPDRLWIQGCHILWFWRRYLLGVSVYWSVYYSTKTRILIALSHLSDNYHPSYNAHRYFAEQVKEILKGTLAW